MFLKIHIYFLSSLVSKEYFDVKEGKPVQIIWNKSSSDEKPRVYRLVLKSEVVAYLPEGSLNMSCSTFIKDPSLKEFCNKRLEFSSNTSSIILKIRDPSRHENWNFTLKYVLTGPSPCNRLDIKIIRGRWLKMYCGCLHIHFFICRGRGFKFLEVWIFSGLIFTTAQEDRLHIYIFIRSSNIWLSYIHSRLFTPSWVYLVPT